ncbi:MAG: hypothetical protein ACUVQQ_01970 [Thermogutta sp.]
MPIKIQCPLCRTEMTVSPAALGGVVGCPWCHHRFRAAPEAAEDLAGPDPASRAPLATPSSADSLLKEAVSSPKASGTKPTAASGGGMSAASGRWKPVTNSEQDSVSPPPPISSSHPPPAGKKEAAAAVPPKITQPRAAPAGRTKANEDAGKRGLTPEAVDSTLEATRGPGQSPDLDGMVRGEPSGSAGTRSQGATEAAKPMPPRKKAVMKILSEPVEPTWTLAADGSLPTLHLQESQTQDQAAKQRSTNPLLLFVILCASMIVSLALVFIEPNPGEVGDTTARNAARTILTEEYIPSLNPQTPPADYQMLLREAQRAHNRGDLKTERELYRRLLLLLYAHRDRAPYEGLTGSAARDRKLEEQLRILLRE